MIRTFKVQSVRTIKSPSNPDIITYFTWVNFKDLPDDFSLEVNPRKPKMTTSVAKQLIKAVRGSNSDFDINNRGMVITAKKVTFETSKSMLTVDLDDDKHRYGVLDGGHTYEAILQNRDEAPSNINKYVKLEIIVGKDLDVSALADARNTSVQVSDIALFELDNKFDFIKQAISSEKKYASEIAYKDNDNKRIPVANLLRLMFAYNLKRYPDDTQVPISAYSGIANVFKDYKKEYGNKSNIYKQLAKQLPKLVQLYEIIQKELPTKYEEFKREEGKRSKFGAVRGISKNGHPKTDFNQDSIKYDISSGYLIPIFGAFRSLLKWNDNKEVYWQFDPIEVWEKIGTSLVQNTFETDTNPQQIGKSKIVWQSNYRIVDGARKDLLIDKLTQETIV
ncbi:AIPR family protein [Lactobacillus bombicola]|uniref:AIPR family protein n=1 Tax=Lactobacillus bombicola TaxID=1505723 RepID=UPI000E58C43A|nr:AIPR family protein [Lactobacillus bombicola]RHW53256.1 abortive phage infection protein [Lactobacillus bombicola]